MSAVRDLDRRHLRILVLPIAVLVLAFAGATLAGCAGEYEEEPEEVGDPEAGTELGAQTSPPADAGGDEYFGTEPTTPAAGTAAVEVRLHGRTIEMPASLPAGETTFMVANEGEDEHSLEIEGNGLEEELESSLQPGESGELTVELEPGTYTVYCPVGDHREEGMVTTLRVVG